MRYFVKLNGGEELTGERKWIDQSSEVCVFSNVESSDIKVEQNEKLIVPKTSILFMIKGRG